MAKVTLESSGRRVFTNLKYLLFTPWVDDGNGGIEQGETVYDIKDIVGDTTSVEQEDNEVNEIPHEFSSSPLMENINLGKKTFVTECIDFRNEVLKELFGWTTDATGNAIAPVGYKPLYATIEMGFNTSDDVVVLPKVLLNSKAVLASMKTDVSRANISGTCYPAYITAGTLSGETDMAVVKGVRSGDNVTVSYEVSAETPSA